MTNKEIRIKAYEVLEKYVTRGGAYKKFNNNISAEKIKFKTIITKDNFLVFSLMQMMDRHT